MKRSSLTYVLSWARNNSIWWRDKKCFIVALNGLEMLCEKNKGDAHDVGEQRKNLLHKKDEIYEIDVFLYYYVVFIALYPKTVKSNLL